MALRGNVGSEMGKWIDSLVKLGPQTFESKHKHCSLIPHDIYSFAARLGVAFWILSSKIAERLRPVRLIVEVDTLRSIDRGRCGSTPFEFVRLLAYRISNTKAQ